MSWMTRQGLQAVGPVLLLLTLQATAQVSTTQIADTIYRADGSVATGTIIVSWPAFTTAVGQAIPGGSTSAPIASGGAFTVQLAPNAGAIPEGTFYTAVYHLDNGSVSREYWVVPVSQSAVTVSSVRTAVLPASVAMQTVSKNYVDTQIAAAVTGHVPVGSLPYIAKAGDAMSGPLVLAGDPTSAAQATSKHYVDTVVNAVSSGVTQKVSTAPQGSQVISQPSGTQMQTNLLNGVKYASQYVGGFGNNGIASAVSAADCAAGCDVKADRSYTLTEGYTPSTWNFGLIGGTHLEDSRGGQRHDSYLNPVSFLNPGSDAGEVIDVVSTRSTAEVSQRTHAGGIASQGLELNHKGLTGGSNLYPATIENPVPYFKTAYSALLVNGIYNSAGQHVLTPQTLDCFGVGDCLMGSQFLRASGGFRDEADEGAHPFDLQIQEDARVFRGTCAGGCTSGSTTVQVAVTSAPGTQGEGRYLIDTNPGKDISTGVLTGTDFRADTPGPGASFSGTSFPVSVFLQTAQVIRSQATNVAPGNVTVTIATGGVHAGFATSTAALPTPSGVACVTDAPNGFNPTNYEMAAYTVVDAAHLQMVLNKVHASGTTVAVGGLCGYGVEQTVDTASGIRQVFPVIGSSSATGLYYAAHLTAILGLSGLTSSYLNVSRPVASVSRSNNVVTLTISGSMPVDVNRLTMTVSGVTDASFNGSFAVTSTGANSVTYSQAGADVASSGGAIGAITGGFVLYPMAEVLGVFNATTKSVDGQLTLAANTVPWGLNDSVEEPHYYQEALQADTEYVGQTTPRATVYQTAGIQYQNNVGPGMRGWTINNAAAVSNYLGSGGTHSAPDAAYEATGVWNRTMEAQAGEISAFQLHCNSHGCGRWNSGYNLFELDSASGADYVGFQPAADTLSVTMGGSNYSFTPQAFSAPNVNTGILNATSLNVTSTTTGPQTLGFLAPHLVANAQFCQGFGTGIAAHSSTFYCWWNAAAPYASLETFAGGDPLQMKGSSLWLNGGPVAIGSSAAIGASLPALLNVGSNAQFQVDANGNVKAANFAGILGGTTGALGGTALAAGGCATAGVAVASAAVGAPVAVSASDGSLPSGLSILSAAVTGPGTVTVQLCAVGAMTPVAKTYNVRVLQ